MQVIYDPRCTAHLRDVAHPESPDRVAGVAAYLRHAGLDDAMEAGRDADDEELARVHGRRYLDRVARDVAALDGRVGVLSTGDTVIDGSSLAVARRAAGSALSALERALATESAVFALIRPPGHHAEPERGMGFCLFNNAAIVARAFVERCGGTVLVVDFDYHHGNGTQAIARDAISFVSTHAAPAYPGTGTFGENRFTERGAIVNLPLPVEGYGTEPFVATWQALLPAVAARVRPDLLVVSAGYDYAAGDPIGDLDVDGEIAARALATIVREVAQSYARGRVVYCLEGGYDVATLSRCVAATIRVHRAGGVEIPAGLDADPAAIPAPQRAALARIAAWAS